MLYKHSKHLSGRFKESAHHFVWLLCLWAHLLHQVDGFFMSDAKAVLQACDDHWTFQGQGRMPVLFQTTVCVDVRVISPGTWTAFSYVSAPAPRFELALQGDENNLYAWLLGVRHQFTVQLTSLRWYHICLQWDAFSKSFSLTIGGNSEVYQRTAIARAIPPSGRLLLGCQPNEASPGVKMATIELYLFRIWDDVGEHKACEDGTVIGWDTQIWAITQTQARVQDNTLQCGIGHLRKKRDAFPSSYATQSVATGRDFTSTISPLYSFLSTVLTSAKTITIQESNQISNQVSTTPSASINPNIPTQLPLSSTTTTHSTITPGTQALTGSAMTNTTTLSSTSSPTPASPLSHITTQTTQTTSTSAQSLSSTIPPISDFGTSKTANRETARFSITPNDTIQVTNQMAVLRTTTSNALFTEPFMVQCNFSQYCANESSYYWMLVEVDGSNLTEKEIQIWFSDLFNMSTCSAGFSIIGVEKSSCQTGIVFVAAEVRCEDKQNIQRTNCTVLLQLSQPVNTCILRRLMENMTTNPFVHIQVLGDIERVGKGLCPEHNVLPSGDGFVHCTSPMSYDDVCKSQEHVSVTCSYNDYGFASYNTVANQSCNVEDLQLCECYGDNNKSEAYYTIRLNIESPDVNFTYIQNMVVQLSAPCNESGTPGSLCNSKEVYQQYMGVHLECFGEGSRLFTCMVALQLSKQLDACTVSTAIHILWKNSPNISFDGPLRRMAICRLPTDSKTIPLNSTFTWTSADKYSDINNIKDNLKCVKGQAFAVLLKENCVFLPPESYTTEMVTPKISPESSATVLNQISTLVNNTQPHTAVTPSTPLNTTVLMSHTSINSTGSQTNAVTHNTTTFMLNTTEVTHSTTSTVVGIPINITSPSVSVTVQHTTNPLASTIVQQITTTPVSTTIQQTATPPVNTTGKPNNLTLPLVSTTIQETTATPQVSLTDTQNNTIPPSVGTTIQQTETTPVSTTSIPNIITSLPVSIEIQQIETSPVSTTIQQTATPLVSTTGITNNVTSPPDSTTIQQTATSVVSTTIQQTATPLVSTTGIPNNITSPPVSTTLQQTETSVVSTTIQQSAIPPVSTTGIPNNITSPPDSTTIQQTATSVASTTIQQTATPLVSTTGIPNNVTSPPVSPTQQQTETSEVSTTIQQTATPPVSTTGIPNNITSPTVSPTLQQTETSEVSTTIQQTATPPVSTTSIPNNITSPTVSPTLQQTETSVVSTTIPPVSTIGIPNKITSPQDSTTVQQTATSPVSTTIQQTETPPVSTTLQQTATSVVSTTIQQTAIPPVSTTGIPNNITSSPDSTIIQHTAPSPVSTTIQQTTTPPVSITGTLNNITSPLVSATEQHITTPAVSTTIQQTAILPVSTTTQQTDTPQVSTTGKPNNIISPPANTTIQQSATSPVSTAGIPNNITSPPVGTTVQQTTSTLISTTLEQTQSPSISITGTPNNITAPQVSVTKQQTTTPPVSAAGIANNETTSVLSTTHTTYDKTLAGTTHNIITTPVVSTINTTINITTSVSAAGPIQTQTNPLANITGTPNIATTSVVSTTAQKTSTPPVSTTPTTYDKTSTTANTAVAPNNIRTSMVTTTDTTQNITTPPIKTTETTLNITTPLDSTTSLVHTTARPYSTTTLPDSTIDVVTTSLDSSLGEPTNETTLPIHATGTLVGTTELEMTPNISTLLVTDKTSPSVNITETTFNITNPMSTTGSPHTLANSLVATTHNATSLPIRTTNMTTPAVSITGTSYNVTSSQIITTNIILDMTTTLVTTTSKPHNMITSLAGGADVTSSTVSIFNSTHSPVNTTVTQLNPTGTTEQINRTLNTAVPPQYTRPLTSTPLQSTTVTSSNTMVTLLNSTFTSPKTAENVTQSNTSSALSGAQFTTTTSQSNVTQNSLTIPLQSTLNINGTTSPLNETHEITTFPIHLNTTEQNNTFNSSLYTHDATMINNSTEVTIFNTTQMNITTKSAHSLDYHNSTTQSPHGTQSNTTALSENATTSNIILSTTQSTEFNATAIPYETTQSNITALAINTTDMPFNATNLNETNGNRSLNTTEISNNTSEANPTTSPAVNTTHLDITNTTLTYTTTFPTTENTSVPTDSNTTQLDIVVVSLTNTTQLTEFNTTASQLLNREINTTRDTPLSNTPMDTLNYTNINTHFPDVTSLFNTTQPNTTDLALNTTGMPMNATNFNETNGNRITNTTESSNNSSGLNTTISPFVNTTHLGITNNTLTHSTTENVSNNLLHATQKADTGSTISNTTTTATTTPKDIPTIATTSSTATKTSPTTALLGVTSSSKTTTEAPSNAIISSTAKTTRSTIPSVLATPAVTITTTSETTESPNEIASNLLNQTQNIESLNSSQVNQLVSQLENILSAPNISLDLGRTVLSVINNFLNSSSNTLGSSSNRLIKAVDDLALKLVIRDQTENIVFDSLVLTVTKVDGANFRPTSFSIADPLNPQVFQRSAESSAPLGKITLPSSLTENLSPEEKNIASRAQFTFYQKSTFFQDQNLDQKKLNSYILGSSVANLSIKNLRENVEFTLMNQQPVAGNYVAVCVFWDFDKNDGLGGWNRDGCSVKNTSTENETICGCNHLTSFAVLLDISQQGITDRQQANILTFISYIGCGVSAIFLSATLITYLAFDKLRRDIPSKILIHLCFGLLFLNLVFLLDSWLALFKEAMGLCISTAFFLHYFLLVSFTWMGLEALHMYLAIVKVFNNFMSRYMLKFSLVGWGVPLVIVIIVIAVNKDNYGLISYGKFSDGTTDDFCWLKNTVAFYVAVVAYFCIIFVLNLAMFLVVMIHLRRIKRRNPHNNQYRSSVHDLRSIAGLTILLGLTWGFAFFAWGPVNLAFTYLFSIFNSLQGFFIFLFHCALKENVRKQWRMYLCCGSLRLAENSEWSRTATQSHNTKKTSIMTANSSNSGSHSAPRSSVSSDESVPSHGIGSPIDDSTIMSEEVNNDVVINEINSQLRSRGRSE